MGKQIATYNNKVKQLVPGYDLKSYSPGTITVTRNSVENEQYASWSQGEDEQGMYIDGYSIGDGKAEYSNNQLVAIVDLYYRYLSPINGENYEGGERPYQLGDNGCIEIDNLSKTIEKGASYEFTLTPKSGFSIVPAGYVEVKNESGWSSIDISWQNTEGLVNITIPSDKITGNLRFVLDDCLYKLYIQKTVDGHNYGDPEEIGTQNCFDTINVDSLKPAENPTGTHFVNITKDGTAISGNQQFCGDTTLNINYTINQYTIDTSGVNSECVDVVLSPNVQTIEHGESLTITLTPKEGKRNIGAGSITMGNTAVRTWTSERSITETISSVEGDIVVIASCGEEDTYTITINWVDGQNTLHTETDIVQSGATILPEDYVGDWTLPEGYYINSMSPAEGTSIFVNSDKTITYDCRLYEYNINFVAGNGITLNPLDPQYVLYGESLTINNVYEINQGYRSATQTHTGNAGVSLNNGSVTVTNVKSDVTITISASQIPSYYVSFAFDDPNAGTLDPDRVQVLEDNCAEIEYTLNEYYTLDTIDTEGPGTETHTSNTVKICDVTGDVTVTINTNYNPPAETHKVTYTLSGDGIQLYKDGAIVPSQTSSDIVEDGNCSEIEYRLTEGYQFNEAISSVQSIVPTVDTTNKTVKVCPTSDVTITLTASQIQHEITYDIYEDGVKIDTQTQTVAEGGTATLQYRKSNTEDYLAPTVSSNDPNLTVNVVKSTSRGYTITGTPVTQDATISLYLVTKPTHNVTFEVYLDGDSDPMYSWDITCTDGETFENEEYDYDTSLYELVEITSEINVNYNDQSGTITMNSLDPITEDTTVEIYLNSIQQKTVTNIYASGMDAMGGVIFQAKFDDGTYDSNQSRFSVSYSDNDGNTSTSKDVVNNVFDYNLNMGTLKPEDNKYSSGPGVYQKSKLSNLDYLDQNTQRNKQVTVTYQGHSETLNIQQRGEQYGYYTGINNSSTNLTNATWVSNSLIDYGDSCNMYDAETKSLYSQGLDIYNKDITPYYITGTYIAENPLNHLDNNVKFYNNTRPVNYNKINTTGYDDHYHITWIEQGPYDSTSTSNRVTSNMKGWVFENDTYQLTSSICGGSAPECNCNVSSESESSSISTLEAINTESSGIEKSITSSYDLSYVRPEHSYGRDSISYYHYKENSEYRTNVNDETFKDSSDNVLNFSYPTHIKSNNTSKSISMNRKNGPGGSNYVTDSIRWEDEVQHDSPSSYDHWDYTYYDYYNRIYPVLTESTSNLTGIHFEKYNQNYYNYDQDYDNIASIVNSKQLIDSESNDQGRIITLYSTFISMETMIRPVFNNGAKFATLNKKYNGLNNDNISPESREDFEINNYVNLGRRTRYISKFFLGEAELAYNGSKDETLLTKQNDYDYGLDINSYPYTIETNPNVDYGQYYDDDSNEYTQATSYDSNLKYRNTHYNKIASISFSQYYNNPASNIQNYYAHNEDGAKYVICGDQFNGSGFYYLYDPSQSSNLRLSDWKNICAEGIKSITYNNSYGTYTIVTNNSTYTDYKRTTADYSDRYYHKELLNLGTKLYTNATDVSVEFDSYKCGDPEYGLGTIELTDVNDSSKKAVWKSGSLSEYIEDNQDELVLNLKVSSDYQEGNISSTKTGGGTVKITCQWRNNNGDLIDTRVISGNIGGSCDSDNNPNESGSYLSWTDLNNIYSEETNNTIIPFTNTGKELYIVNLDNKYYDLKNNEEIQ